MPFGLPTFAAEIQTEYYDDIEDHRNRGGGHSGPRRFLLPLRRLVLEPETKGSPSQEEPRGITQGQKRSLTS